MTKRKLVELARKSIKGDIDAFETLCRTKQRDMLFVATSILGNLHDAEDAVQESIIRMHKNICNMRDAAAINVWIERIVRNESYKIYNSRAIKKDDIDIDDEDVNIQEDNRDFLPEAYAEDAALSKKLYEHVLSLSAAKRDAIIMYYYEGLSYKEIATVTNTSIKTVSSNITKARMMLKKILSKETNNFKAMLGLGAAPTSTVMGRALQNQSVHLLPDEKLFVFEQKWQGAIQGKAFVASRGTGIVKSILKMLIGAATISVVVYVLTVTGRQMPPLHAVADPGGREIVLASSDCDCGHINPQGVDIAHLETDDHAATWTIYSKTSGDIIFEGADSEVDTALRNLSSQNQDGRYTLTCKFFNKDDDEVTLDRDFIIGEYTGDSDPNA
ncbi:MAG: sigma-70 family RNA polymerase sigma factor [Clostridiales Family XIII bacterium]|jgi:RNA polymerase sigma-70 factor (ECF subfamily)|nr:sigma-70 family RNA polymerase sigma factor [Clostridiales Family XIII bacterium]